MKTILAIAILIATLMIVQNTNAFATPWNIQISLLSKHFENGKDFGPNSEKFNEFNPGIGLEYLLKDDGAYLTGGYFKNSLNRSSAYAGYGKQWNLIRFIDAGLMIGATTGYMLPITPIALPYISIGYKSIYLKTYFIPPIHKATPGGFGFQVRIPLRFN